MNEATKKMRFHITITDNETGETHLDSDSPVIIGGIGDEKGVNELVLAACDPATLAQAALYAENAAKSVYEEDKFIRHIMELGKIIEAKNQEENEEKGE